MKASSKVCRHCGSPSRGNPCWGLPADPNFDPPCYDDFYRQTIDENRSANMRFALSVLIVGVMLCLGVLFGLSRAKAETGSGWWQTDAVRRCCSEADAVYADTWEIMPDGNVRATVTGGGPRNHSWAPLGRVYEVPADRIIREPGNPTGRPLLFLSPSSLNLWCFAMGAGI